jgi:hypothetical protein
LIEEFSRRSQDIDAAKSRLVAEFIHAKRRQPTPVEVLRLRLNAPPASNSASATRTQSRPTPNTTASDPATATTCSTRSTKHGDDISHGLTSPMIAGDRESVAQLNLRARTDRTTAGHVEAVGVDVAGGTSAGVRIITRENDRRLNAGRPWVKNGDAWVVQTVHPDGTLTVQRENHTAQVTLPAAYVRSHVELGYAATTIRAQGRTVDTAHTLVGNTTTRGALYVSATRGRQSAYALRSPRHRPGHRYEPLPVRNRFGRASPRGHP